MKVLVINDQFFILEMLKEIVQSVNITDVDSAFNGLDAFIMV